MAKNNKMHFTQIGKGRLSFEVQDAFEEAQRHVDLRKTSATGTLKIKVYPPNAQDANFGEVDFRCSVAKPATQSRRFATLIENGVITSSGSDPTDALQIDAIANQPATANQGN